MNAGLFLVAPFALLFPGFSMVEAPPVPVSIPAPAAPPVADQVSIEQRVTIRINPRPAPMPFEPAFFDDGPDRGGNPRFIERKIGKCVPVAGIMGIQPVSADRLLFIMRDNRLITARLSKGCQAREFYSGMMLKRSDDGQICVKRDELYSRSGASCQVVGFRQLVPVGG